MTTASKRALKLALKLFIVLAVILLISLALLIWRLSSSPMELNFLSAKIEQLTSNLPGGLSVRLKGIELFWNRADSKIDLRAVDVKLFDDTGARIVSEPSVNISLSGPALLDRVVALSSIELNEINVTMIRNEDGSFQFFKKKETAQPKNEPAAADEPSRDLTQILNHAFEALKSDGDPQQPLSYLENIQVKGSLTLEDRKTGNDWKASDIDFEFSSLKGSVAGDLGLVVAGPEFFAGTKLKASLTASGDSISARAQIADFHPAGLAQLDPGLASLAGLDLTFAGTVSAELTLPDTFHKLEVDIQSGAGKLSIPQFYSAPLLIDSLKLQASADPQGKSLQLAKLEITLGEAGSVSPSLGLAGSAQLGDDTVSLNIKSQLQQLQVDELDHYWPTGIVNAARGWLVTNVKEGSIDQASLDLGLVIPTGPGGKFVLQELKGSLDYSNLKVSYFGSLPAATGVSGSGTYDRHGFDLGVDAGRVNGIRMSSGKVVIAGMDQKKLTLSVDTHLEGELADVFAVLEAPPLELNRVTGFGSGQMGGQVESDFSIALPLRAGLDKVEIKYRAEGKLTAGVVRKIYRDYGVQAASLGFSVDQTDLKFKGPLEFSGVPVNMNWTMHVAEDGAASSNIEVTAAEITAEQIQQLGYKTGNYLQGSLALNIEAKLTPGGAVDAHISTDLLNAKLVVPQVHWSKAAGAEASASAVIQSRRGHPIDIDDIRINFGTLIGSGKAEFDRPNSRTKVELEKLLINRTHLKGIDLTLDEVDGIQLGVQGGELDLEPFFAGDSDKKTPPAAQEPTDQAADVKTQGSTGILFELKPSSLDKVFFSPERYLQDIKLSARRDLDGWQELTLSGQNPLSGKHAKKGIEASQKDMSAEGDQVSKEGQIKSGQFDFTFGPSVGGQYPLQIETENLGSLLSTVMAFEAIEGGNLVVTGHSTGPLLTKPVEVALEVKSFSAVNAPLMTQLLSMASLNQLMHSLKNEGLEFSSVTGDITLDSSRLSIGKLKAVGGSMGLTADGWTDLKEHSLDFSGAIIPLQEVSNVVGKIPLLGKIMVGDDGKGIVSMDYKLKGNFDQPKVSVQPGSLLTPGILKNIFNLGEKANDEESK